MLFELEIVLNINQIGTVLGFAMDLEREEDMVRPDVV